jgi:hypothetical protein
MIMKLREEILIFKLIKHLLYKIYLYKILLD